MKISHAFLRNDLYDALSRYIEVVARQRRVQHIALEVHTVALNSGAREQYTLATITWA